VSELTIDLTIDSARVSPGEDPELTATYRNTGAEPLTLFFWWNRFLRVTDAEGRDIPPGSGPVLPCGAAEEPTTLEPGAHFSRPEAWGCTQPAGSTAKVGWSYDLAPGTYQVRLVFESPAAHGYDPSAREPQWRGRIETAPIELIVA
jgi:hypothetical protein